MKKIVFVVVVLLAQPVLAQPSLTLVWNQEGVAPAEAQDYVYRMYLDQLAPVVLQGVLCKTVPDNITECSVPLPIPSIGLHSLQLTASNDYGEGPKSPKLDFRYPAVPGAPTQLRIVK